jgi:Asp-tRNA(Asn)/Glu-tRNA(Gln) amidotransferase A subunit family amidase
VQTAFEPTVRGREGELSPMYRAWREKVAQQPALDGQEWMNTMIGRDALRGNLLRKMEQHPILLGPVCAIPAFRHGEREWTVQGRQVEYLKAMSYSQWFNLLGSPAVSVPVGKSPEGLPIGVQVIGRPWEDEAVLAVAERIEEAVGAFRPPPL